MSEFWNAHKHSVGGDLTEAASFDMLDAMKRQMAMTPPALRAIFASHAVPYGRVYRMWNTRGEMIAYVNRGEIEDMPRVKVKAPRYGLAATVIFGTPVCNC